MVRMEAKNYKGALAVLEVLEYMTEKDYDKVFGTGCAEKTRRPQKEKVRSQMIDFPPFAL